MKTHAQLGITLAEHGALLGSQALLRSGKVRHRRSSYLRGNVDGPLESSPSSFNMCYSSYHSACGTALCLGGLMATIMNVDPQDYVSGGRSESLDPLFFPPTEYNWDRIKASYAVDAIDNFVNTGRPKWEQVLSDLPKHR